LSAPGSSRSSIRRGSKPRASHGDGSGKRRVHGGLKRLTNGISCADHYCTVQHPNILRRKRAVACTKSRSQSRSVSGERLAIVLLFLLVSILVHNCNPRRCVRLSAFVLRPLGPLGYGSQERQGHARLRKRVPGTSSLLTNHGRKRKVRSSHLRRGGCHGRTMV